MKAMPRLFLASVVILLSGGLIASPVSAKPAVHCGECHSRQEHPDSLLSHSPSSIADLRSVYHARLDPCPAIRSFSEEVFFTESRIHKLNQILNAIESERGLLESKMTAIAESFSALKNQEKISAAQFAQESFVQRTALQKIYDRTLQVRDEAGRRRLIGLSSLLFLGLFALGAIGYRKLGRMGKPLLLFLLLGASLCAGACFYASQAPAKKSPAQERLEGSLAAAAQTSRGMQDAFSQSILLADLVGEWSKI